VPAGGYRWLLSMTWPHRLFDPFKSINQKHQVFTEILAADTDTSEWG